MKTFFLNDNSCGDGELGKEILEQLLLESIALAGDGENFIFTNEACNLACRTEHVAIIKALQDAAAKGVKVYVCQHSLKRLGLENSLHVGESADFQAIALLLKNGEVISL